jgi:hypothetical protein
MSPAKSKAQANLMRAAARGASFEKAKEVRASMTPSQLAEFTHTPTKDLPRHVKKTNRYGKIGP